MVRLYMDFQPGGYIKVEAETFYCNDYPMYFAKTGKGTYLRSFEPFYEVPRMSKGSQPTDNGNLIIKAKDYGEFISREPAAQKWIRPFVGAEEFIHNKKRYCLWLENCPLEEIKSMPLVYERVKNCREFRLASKSVATRKCAETPWLFQTNRQPKTDYLLVPSVSGERRKYVPIGYMDAEVIASNLVFTVPTAKWWLFGVLTSLPHMVWMRFTCGRLGMSYRYSNTLCYNPFPFPPFYREVERTAFKILEARKKYADMSLADLYDSLTMPRDLCEAHEENDRAVLEAYGLPGNLDEYDIFKELLKRYQYTLNMEEIIYGVKNS